MRILYLIRHAKSSWDSADLKDFDRPLNKRGLKDAAEMAELLALRGIKPDLIVSSPARRAYSTACFFADAFHIPEADIVQKAGIYEAIPYTILQLIHGLPDTAGMVLLFGHNPTFTDVANIFARRPIENLPTCGIVEIESSADQWAGVSETNSKVRSTFFPKELL